MIRFLYHTKQLDFILKLTYFSSSRAIPLLLAPLVLAACAANPFSSNEEDSILRDKSLDYAQSQVVARLTVPADLDNTSIQKDLLTVPSSNGVLPKGIEEAPRPDFVFAETGSASARLVGDGLQKRISVAGHLSKIKAQVAQFWANQRIAIVAEQNGKENQIETQWFSLSDKPQSDDFITRWIRGLTDADDNIAHGRVKIKLEQKTTNHVELVLSFIQQNQLQISQQESVNWDAAGQTLSNESELTFELLRYLSRTGQVAQKNSQSEQVKSVALLGKDQFDQPVIQLDMDFEHSFPIVLQTMSEFDVGSHNVDAKLIYFTHTSHQRAPQPESSSNGILGWFKGLHSGDRKQGININLALFGAGDEKTTQIAAPVYSSNVDSVKDTTNLADRKGYKIWLGGEVIYVFEDENQGNVDTSGEYTFIGRYQLTFEETLKSTYVQVLNSQGLPAPKLYAEEILWKIQQGLDAQ